VKPAKIAALRRRWTGDDSDHLRQQLLDQARIVKGPHTLRSRWPETGDGLVDLRGIAPGTAGLAIRYLTLERLDMSFARGAISVFESELFDCRFDSVTLTGQPRFNRRFERCSFRDAKLSGLSLGPRLLDCDFTAAKATKLRSVPNTQLERCAFDDADLAGAVFSDTSFVDCSFDNTRLSASTVFRRCSFVRTDVDFSAAQVSRSTRDGSALPDRWEGEAQANTAMDRYLKRYARAVASGTEDDMPLEPEEQDEPPRH
jgi:uncharacterized protein YjbI with pentapeptide repeats